MSDSKNSEHSDVLISKKIEDSGNVSTEWSNQTVLIVTCASFTIFVIAEIVGAFASNSLSLLGDAAAMSVDVFTYLSNIYVERVKARSGGHVDAKTRFIIDVIVPSISVFALVIVSIYVTLDAIRIIAHPSSSDGDDVNVYFLYGFSCANMVVDLLSSYMFYAKKDSVFETVDGNLLANSSQAEEVNEDKKGINLNMMSALTHVGGDTLRTIAVFISAVVSSATSISSDITDAWAAVVVTITIFALIIPLVNEIVKAALKSQ